MKDTALSIATAAIVPVVAILMAALFKYNLPGGAHTRNGLETGL